MYPAYQGDAAGPQAVWYHQDEDDDRPKAALPFIWLSGRGCYICHGLPEDDVCLIAGYCLLHGIPLFGPEIVGQIRDGRPKTPTPKAKGKKPASNNVVALPTSPTKH